MKDNSDITKYDFFSHYRKNTKFSKIDRTLYSKFVTELVDSYTRAIVEEGMELNMGRLGYLRIKTVPFTGYFNKEGNLRKLQVDWKKTWDKWYIDYADKTKNEIDKIKGKTVIFHENTHTNGEYYKFFWDNTTRQIKFKSFYRFKPARQYKKLITKVVLAKPRTIFYYE